MTALTFSGVKTPRQNRALQALMRGPVSREQLDRAAGVSNSPSVVRSLRRRGLEIPCTLVERTDRDGSTCRPGVYELSQADRQLICKWMNGRA